MQEPTDAQLLRGYAEHRDEAAFRELVSRHADVVYASALRQVSSPDLAQDIAQTVFTDLARKAQPLAGTLSGDASLLGWLYRSTRFLALNQLRDDRRRQARERQAMEHFDSATDTAPEWERVQPVLDEAMADLSDEDRDALLLRFFKNRDFRAIGTALGVSDDAAQKRVSRALERLRTQLTSRGVTTTAVALSTVLSTNAVPLAPAGLAATLSTAALAGTTLATAATATTIKTIVMTTLQKTVITVTIALITGVGIYEARKAASLQDQLESIRQQQQSQPVELTGMRKGEPQVASSRIDEYEQARKQAEHLELLRLRGEVGQLRRQVAERNPSQELGQPTITPFNRAPTTKAEMELAARQVSTAMFRVESALRRFITNNPYGSLFDANGNPNPDIFANTPGLPLESLEIQVKDIQSLAKAFDEKSRAILAVTKMPIFFDGYYTRYYLLADGSVRSDFSYGSDEQNFTSVYPSDEELDAMRQRAQEDGKLPENILAIRKTLESVAMAFLAANNGRGPTDLAQLAPYATTQEQQAALKTLLELKQDQASRLGKP